MHLHQALNWSCPFSGMPLLFSEWTHFSFHPQRTQHICMLLPWRSDLASSTPAPVLLHLRECRLARAARQEGAGGLGIASQGKVGASVMSHGGHELVMCGVSFGFFL